jgi:hypothetical protein
VRLDGFDGFLDFAEVGGHLFEGLFNATLDGMFGASFIPTHPPTDQVAERAQYLHQIWYGEKDDVSKSDPPNEAAKFRQALERLRTGRRSGSEYTKLRQEVSYVMRKKVYANSDEVKALSQLVDRKISKRKSLLSNGKLVPEERDKLNLLLQTRRKLESLHDDMQQFRTKFAKIDKEQKILTKREKFRRSIASTLRATARFSSRNRKSLALVIAITIIGATVISFLEYLHHRKLEKMEEAFLKQQKHKNSNTSS